MNLYVMRHGQTNWNVLGKVQGCTDIELNETGMKQAQKAKEEFNQCDIDIIFSSPLKRAKKTAEIVSQDKKVPVICDVRLREREFGELEGKNPETCQQKFCDAWNYSLNVKTDNVEPVVECCNRVSEFLDELKENYQDKNVLLVTHGGTAQAIQAYFTGIEEDGQVPRTGIANCEIRKYELNEIFN